MKTTVLVGFVLVLGACGDGGGSNRREDAGDRDRDPLDATAPGDTTVPRDTTTPGDATAPRDNGPGPDGGRSGTAMTLWTQAVDGMPGGPDDNLADLGREVLVDEATDTVYLVGFGVSELGRDIAMTGFVRSYTRDGTPRRQTPRLGRVESGRQTRLFNSLLAQDPSDGRRYLYVSGKSDTPISALCPPGGLRFPDNSNMDNSTNGLIMKFDPTTLAVVDCLMIQSTGPGFDEIATMEYAAGSLWVAGSTTGSVVGGPTAASRCAMGERLCNDTIVARVSPTLNEAPTFFQFGTPYFDEDLGGTFDEAANVFYISGSTIGELCLAYPTPGLPCTNGAGPSRRHNNFDSYLAAMHWTGSAFELRWVYQFGQGSGLNQDRDVSHEVVRYTDPAGTRYLYETGYTPAGATSDLRISRLQLDGRGFPAVVGGAVAHRTLVLGSPEGGGDSGSTLFVGAQRIWVSANWNGGRDHAGACGRGNGTTDTSDPPDGTLDDSTNEGHVFGFLHSTFATAAGPDTDFTVLGPRGAGAAGQRSVLLEGLTHANGRFWAAGSTSAHFVNTSTAGCGSVTSEEYDDETDAIVFTMDYPSP